MNTPGWGSRIREARGGRSQQWLADQVGVNQKTVSLWENGAPVSDEAKVRIAVAIGWRIDDLFPWDCYEGILEALRERDDAEVAA